jgi:hypothetical protein
VISADEVRQLALTLPGAVEADHHGRPSFRVAGKIFATLWSDEQLNVMLDEAGIHTAVHSWGEACRELWWGRRLAAVAVDLDKTDRALVAALLNDAWEYKAPKRAIDAEPTVALVREDAPDHHARQGHRRTRRARDVSG